MVAWCDDQTIQSSAPASLHLPFKLSISGETLTLTAPDGTIVDTVTFTQQVTDVSQGRSPDGSATIAFLGAPTAGSANQAPISSPAASATTSTPGTVNITVTATAGFSYRLQIKDDLNAATWTNLGLAVTASGNSVTFTDTPGAQTQRFYRVVRSP